MQFVNSMVLFDGFSRLETSRFCFFVEIQTKKFKAIDLSEQTVLFFNDRTLIFKIGSLSILNII